MFNSVNEMAPITIEQFVTAFYEGFQRADGSLVQDFEGRAALVVNVALPDDDRTQTELNQHPGVIAMDDSDDPTLRAVFLGNFTGKESV